MSREIVYILPNAMGGVAGVVSNLIRFSTHPDIHKKVILTGPCNDKLASIADFGTAEVIAIPQRNPWIESRYSYARKIAAHLSFDSVIVSNDGFPEFSMIEMLGLTNPVIAVLHGDNPHYFRGACRYGYLIDKMICVSSYLEKKAKSSFVSTVNPLFIPFPTPDAITKPKDFNGKLKISYAGAITASKGCEYFPCVISSLDEKGIDYEFNIFGQGDLLQSLRQQLACNNRVVFHGPQPNKVILQALVHTHVTIHLSKNEGLPVCLVEAMKSGSVPVVFDLPTGIHDIIDNNINGYIFPQGDIANIVNQIELLDRNRKLLESRSKEAMAKANSMFSPRIQTTEYERIILETESNPGKFDNIQSSLKKSIFQKLPTKLTETWQKIVK